MAQRILKYPSHSRKVLKGNFAAAEAAKLCRVEFVPAYPITPQTSIIEEIAAQVASGKMNCEYVNMDSEHSVFAAAKGASLGGLRVFTATSGQGLLYAHEVLHAIAHMRLPIVACNVGRPSFPWNIWCDHSDSMAQRDTGWIQFYSESSQEALDTIIQSYRIAEKLRIPVLVMIDGFYQSHTSENVWIPDIKLVDNFLPVKGHETDAIETESPKAFGGLVPPMFYDNFNKLFWDDINKAEDLVNLVGKDFGNSFGREYGAVETVNISKKTKMVLVTLGTITSTVRGIIGNHPEVGLLKIRLLKPFPQKSVLRALQNVSDNCMLVNIDRNYMGGNDGGLMQEMKQALYGKSYRLFNVYAGLGGKDVPATTIEKIIDRIPESVSNIMWADVD